MEFEAVWIIIAIFWWFLCAALLVVGLVWLFCYVNYYRWDKEDREHRKVMREVDKKVGERLDEELDLGGGIQES